jgi:hypothetical protein
MSKTSSEELQARVQAVKARLELVIDFVAETNDFPSASQIRAIVAAAAARRDLRTLRLVRRDIDAMTIALAPEQREALSGLLRERLGIDVESERLELKRAAETAIARGRVASEKERRRLEDYAEMLEATGGDPTEIESILRLVNSR